MQAGARQLEAAAGGGGRRRWRCRTCATSLAGCCMLRTASRPLPIAGAAVGRAWRLLRIEVAAGRPAWAFLPLAAICGLVGSMVLVLGSNSLGASHAAEEGFASLQSS